MAVIEWNRPVDQEYRIGCSHGVLYVGADPGVAWNGLQSVEKSAGQLQPTPAFWDGKKYADIDVTNPWNGVLRCLTYPAAFEECLGEVAYEPGVLISNQTKKRFGLSYRVQKGNSLNGIGGYVIHVLYGLLASPQALSHQTLSSTPTLTPFTFNLTGRPEYGRTYRPTVHISIDSDDLDPARLSAIEDILYGTAGTDPRLPTLDELLDSISIFVTDNGDGSASVEGPDYLVVYEGDGEATFYQIDSTVIDAETIEITTTGV